MEEATYTKVENYLIHALCRVKVKPAVLQTVLALCRLTIGFHISERIISYGQFSRFTGFDRGYQARCVKKALEGNMITRYNIRGQVEANKTAKYCYSLNLDPLTWNVPMRLPAKHFGVERKKKTLPIEATGRRLQKQQSNVALLNNVVLDNALKEPWRFG